MTTKKNKFIITSVMLSICGIGIWMLSTFSSPRTPSNQSLTNTSLDVNSNELENNSDSKPVKINKKTTTLESNKLKQLPATPTIPDTPPIADTLEGTDIDGQLKADADGNLIIDLAVRDFFEYFLNTQKEIGLDAAINEILRYAEKYLPELAFLQTKALLGQYVKYKQFDLELRDTPLDPSKPLQTEDYIALLKDSFKKLGALKKDIFSDDVNKAFFGAEDAYADYTIKNLEIQTNSNLSFEEKQAQMHLNKAALPQEMFETEAILEYQQYSDKQVEELLTSSADDAEIQEQLIAKGYPQEKVEEILLYKQQQKDFYQRFEVYRKIRNHIASQQLTTDELLSALSVERNQHFMSSEEKTKAYMIDLTELNID